MRERIAIAILRWLVGFVKRRQAAREAAAIPEPEHGIEGRTLRFETNQAGRTQWA